MTTTDDVAAVTSVLNELVAAWGRHDADAYGELFTDDATYITFLGTLYQGRQDIVDSHRSLFGGSSRALSSRVRFSAFVFLGRMWPSSTVVVTPIKASGRRSSPRSRRTPWSAKATGDGVSRPSTTPSADR